MIEKRAMSDKCDYVNQIFRLHSKNVQKLILRHDLFLMIVYHSSVGEKLPQVEYGNLSG